MRIKKAVLKRIVVMGLAGLLAAVLLLGVLAAPARANGIPLPENDCELTTPVVVLYTDDDVQSPAGIVGYIEAKCGPDFCRTYRAEAQVVNFTSEDQVPSDILAPGPNWVLVSDTCPPDSAPAIWASDVCEPYGGGYFSADGNLTLDSDKTDAILYVAASQSGPWLAAEANGPPWVLTASQLQALADAVGAGHYSDLWVRPGENGTASNLGSMIADRNARIGEWCPPIEDAPPE